MTRRQDPQEVIGELRRHCTRLERDKAEARWQRRNAANGRIVAVSGEGYRRRSHTVGMAFALHEWATEVHIADGRDAGQIIERRA